VRKIARSIILSFASFLLVSYFYPGFSFERVQVLVISAFVFSLLILTVNPILKVLSLPLNLFTFGLFNFFSGALLIYIVGSAVSGFSIVAYNFPGAQISGFAIPSFLVTSVFSSLIASFLIGWLNTFLKWVFH